MASERSTKKQQELLQFIDGFIKGSGYGPSYREIMRALGYKSVSTVAIHIDQLVTKGYLEKNGNSARSLSVVSLRQEAFSKTGGSDAEAAKKIIEKKIADLQSQAGQEQAIETLKSSLDILGLE